MASRLDRLFALLESCPNETLRITAARQLGELAQKAPEDVDITLARLRGLLHSKSWKSRIAAAEAIRSMIAHLPPWLPTHKAMDTKEEGEEKKREKTSQSVATSFLSLAGLNLDLVLEHGARLYSMDLREFAKEKPNTAKRQKRGSSTEERRDSSAISTTTNVGVLLDRREMNRQLGLEDQANAFICTLLESQPNTSISSLICDADLADDEENTTSDSEGLGDMATSASVMESVKRAYKSANALSKTSVMKQDASALSPAEVAARTDWPLNGMCMRLLADLWDCRWETRHGAASGLRELLAFPQHTRQAGARNGASNEENRAANRIYLEDVVVRVLCTLALDQFSDFACDVIVAPVRQTAAQLLGVLCLHLDVGQVRLVVQHLLCLICLFRRQRHLKQQPTKRTHTPKVNWMVAHGSLLGLNYLLSARSDLAADLLPLIYGPLTDVLLLSYENDEDDTRKLGTEGVDVEAGEEDLRCAACNALLALPRDLLLAHCNAVGHRLVTYVWVLLERAAGELSPATGPLLTLASKLINYSVTTSTSEPHKGASASLTNGTCDLEQAEVFTKRVIMVLHFLHHSSSEIRRTAVETLDSLLSLRLQKSGGLMEVPLLECIFEQLFHRVLLESDTKIIHSVSDLWHRMVNAMPVGLLAHATLNRVDFWLCQAMQPTSLPFADNMLRLLTSSSSQETTQSYYIGGYELGSINERTRQNVALETRITATALLAYLSNRLCENNFSTALAVPPVATAETSPESMRSGDTRGSANDNVNVEMSVSGYILEHVVGGTHLRDRLGMQRFVGSLLLAAWPPAAAIATNMRGDLSSRLTNCLTNVVYYEEILGVFKAMHEDCHRLRALCEATRLPIDMGPPKAGGNVLNLVECQALLDRVGADLHKCASAEATSSTTNLTELEFEEVHRALQKAQLSVSRCLALQLFWSSRVELSLSSALVNFGWVTPGRLTPLIRPFMDTIRVTAATSAQPLNDFDLPQPGENLRLQRLAAWNLARLLWSESRQNFSASAPSTSAVSSSKALVKVTQNLTKYILPDEFIEWDALIDKTVKGGDDEGICLTALLMEEKTIPYGEKDDVCGGGGGNYCSTTAISSTTAPATGRKQSTQQLRRCGSFMALFALLRTFTADIDITKSKLEEILPQRLPTLWQILWLEPLAALHRRAGTSSNGSFAEDVKFLQKKCNVSSVERDTNPKASSDLEVFCRSLHLLPAVVFATLPSTGTSVPTGLITGLVSLTMRSLTGTASSSCSSTLSSSPRLRFTAAHTLAVLAASHSVLIVIILNTLFLLVASPDSPASDSDKVAALEAVYHIIDCILTPRAENQVFHNLQLVPCEQPLSPRLHGVSLDDSGKLSSSNSTSTPLQALLAYVVVMLTSLVLPHFADPRSNVRLLASNVFTKLLVLLPLEESAPEPPSPGLPPTLRATREKGRHFVQCLLRPNDINLYLPDENVHAELRPYQQEGVNWLLFLKQYGLHGILADDLGLGKTLQTICALVSHHGQGDRGRKRDRDRLYAHRKSADTSDEGSGVGMSLVICPATLCAHWQGEVKRFVPDRRLLEPRVYVGSLDQRVALQKSIWGRCNLLITTYEMVRNDLPFFQETFWEYLILDEGHIIKNAKSKISCAVKRLRARHRLILTGTPIQNRVSELWSLFDFLMPGFLAPSEAAFNARFARPLVGSRCPKATLQLQRAGQQALEELHRIVTPFVLRRLKEEVLQDLPPKVIQDYLCTMTPLQSKLYETFTKTPEGKEALNLALDQSTSASCIATTRLGSHGGFRSIKYLLAVCNHPRLVLTPEHPLYDWALENCTSERGGLDDFHLSGKLMALKQLLLDCGFGDSRNVTNNGEGCSSDDTLLRSESEEQNELLRQHRALIFFQTKKMLNLVTCLLNAEFKSLVHLRLDGSVSLAARQALVSRFNVDPSIDALLLTTAVGGLGLNLTGADTVIFVEHDWNPCRDLQAMDRAHRIGQRRVVSVFRLITADSIEERIMSLQTFKSHLARTLVSQPDNRALGEMDTSRLIDNMAAAAREGTSALMSAPSGDSDEPSWGDAEAAEYAAEYNMDEFLARLPREG